jgi:aspartate aminotransferase
MLTERVKAVKPSMTLAVIAKVRELKARGIEVIDFGAGEPDFDTPDNIKDAAVAALEENFTRYTAASGIPELRKAIAGRIRRDNQLDYSPEQIVVTNGGKQAIYNALQSLAQEGDEVVVPSPYWVSYPEMVVLSGARPVIVQGREENEFRVTPSEVEAALTDRTRVFILCSPQNPTGTVYSRGELEAFAAIFVERGIHVISDEVYDKLRYTAEPHASIAQASPEMKKLTVLVNSLSKTYAMTGWRIGFSAAEKEITSAMAILQSQSTSGVNSITQKAAVAALTSGDGLIEERAQEFRKRRDYAVDRINSIEGLSCILPGGAFFLFFSVACAIGKTFGGTKVEDSISFTTALLEQKHVAVVPGVGFGAENYIRLSYATGMQDIEEGLNRLEEFLQSGR